MLKAFERVVDLDQHHPCDAGRTAYVPGIHVCEGPSSGDLADARAR